MFAAARVSAEGRRLRFAPALCAIIFFVLLAPCLSGAATQARMLDSSSSFRLAGNYSNAEIIPNLETAHRIARTHAILVISAPWQLGVAGTWDGTARDTYWDEMMAANPSLLIFRYLNAMYDPGRGYPESWYMHNASGHRLFNGTYGTYLMDPRSTEAYATKGEVARGWVDYLIKFYRRDASRWPGVFNGGIWLDDVGGMPHVVDATTRQPSNAVTKAGTPWNERDWYALTTGVARQLRDATGQLVVVNALMSGNCYFTGCGGSVATNAFLRSNDIDGAMAEGWLTAWYNGTAALPTYAGWRQDVQMIIDANQTRRAVQVMTAPPKVASASEIDRWRLFAYASFLLANGGHAYFQFAPHCNPTCGGGAHTETFEMANPLYSLNIGLPLSTARTVDAYARRGGAYYMRDYSNGKVIVNPRDRPVTVELGGRYVLSDGRTVSTFELGPGRGEIALTLRHDATARARGISSRIRSLLDPPRKRWGSGTRLQRVFSR